MERKKSKYIEEKNPDGSMVGYWLKPNGHKHIVLVGSRWIIGKYYKQNLLTNKVIDIK